LRLNPVTDDDPADGLASAVVALVVLIIAALAVVAFLAF
jgi:hypothetical protein